MLYVHGFTDYFFQREVAERLTGQGHSFYAVDLRKSGRSRRPGQTAHYVSDLALHDVELEAARTVIGQAHRGRPLIVVAHSLGGLLPAMWLNRRRARQRLADVTALVLNSPWLELRGSAFDRLIMTRLVALLAKRWPRFVLPSTEDRYGRSLHVSTGGQWDFDLALKPLSRFRSPRAGSRRCATPRPNCTGASKSGSPPWCCVRTAVPGRGTTGSDADMVLDVAQIARWESALGEDITDRPVPRARHDVFLSEEQAREDAYDALLGWLRQRVAV